MPQFNKTKTVLSTALVTTAIVYGSVAPFLLPPALNYAFGDSLFWVSALTLVFSCAMVGYVFATRGTSSRNMLFFFGCALVVMAALTYGAFGMVAEHAAKVPVGFVRSNLSLFSAIQQFVLLSRDLISFGIAAFGSNIAASAALDRGQYSCASEA